jgi:hypothetical protein
MPRSRFKSFFFFREKFRSFVDFKQMSGLWSMFWFKSFRKFFRKIAIFQNFDHWSEILSMSAGRPISQGVCPPLSAEWFGMEFREFSVRRNSQNSAGTNQLFRPFRLPRNNFFSVIANPNSIRVGNVTLQLEYE